MIDAAANAGCDAVKVQSYRCFDFLPPGHPDWPMFERYEIWPWLEQLADYAHRQGLLFGVTPASIEGVEEAAEVGADWLKNGSDCLLYTELIEAMLDTGLPVWVSTGMGAAEEIMSVPEEARLMLCTSLYPCPDDQAHLARMATWYRGFSDHTMGSTAAVIATAFGAEMIEKHFTLDRQDVGPDHSFSADPQEMAELVAEVRKADVLLGYTSLGYTPGELEGRAKWRVTKEVLRSA